MPSLAAALVYNRGAISHGEVWRLATGNVTHLSIGHFARDLSAFVVIGVLAETKAPRHFAMLCLASSVLIGVVLYIADLGLLVYGGLSGVVTAAIVYYCLHTLQHGGHSRTVHLAVLACMALKLALELKLGRSLLGAMDSESVELVPLSHLAGGASAAIFFAATQFLRPRERKVW